MQMKVEEIPIEDLKPAEYNPRQMTAEQVKGLRDSVKKFGLVDPIVANANPDRKNVVVGGHQRLRIAREEGMKTVPVVYVNLDEKDEQELNLRLNRNLGEWDWDLLSAIDTDLLKEVGFNEQELLKHLDVYGPDEKDDDVPEAPEEPKSKLGEVYQLGSHRVMCGDSTKKEDVDALMDGKSVDLVFTSPPYSDMRDYNGDKDLSIKHLATFLSTFSASAAFHVVNLGLQRKDGEIYPYWDQYIEAARSAGLKFLSWNIWNRSGSGGSVGAITAMFPVEHEWLFVFGKSADKEVVKKTVANKHANQHRSGGDRQKDGTLVHKHRVINEYRRMGTVQNIDFERDLAAKRSHPAVFPVQLALEYIKSLAETSVADPFLGSGSTLIAAEKTGRICYGMELDPKYIDVTIERWEQYTGQKAQQITQTKE